MHDSKDVHDRNFIVLFYREYYKQQNIHKDPATCTKPFRTWIIHWANYILIHAVHILYVLFTRECSSDANGLWQPVVENDWYMYDNSNNFIRYRCPCMNH